MKLFLFLCIPFLLVAKVHYAKIESYDSITLKSAVSALVMEVDLDAEGSIVDQKRVISLDDRLDKINLDISKKNLLTLRETLKRQESYYHRINRLKTTSETQKDNAFYSFANAKTQYLEMKFKVAQLEDSIAKKSIILENKYLYKLMVRKGEYVNPGTALAEIRDATKAKLVLFLEPEEIMGVEKRDIYLNGKKTDLKVDKVWKIADEKFISSYRAEIYLPAPSGLFSELMKVEIK